MSQSIWVANKIMEHIYDNFLLKLKSLEICLNIELQNWSSLFIQQACQYQPPKFDFDNQNIKLSHQDYPLPLNKKFQVEINIIQSQKQNRKQKQNSKNKKENRKIAVNFDQKISLKTSRRRKLSIQQKNIKQRRIFSYKNLKHVQDNDKISNMLNSKTEKHFKENAPDQIIQEDRNDRKITFKNIPCNQTFKNKENKHRNFKFLSLNSLASKKTLNSRYSISSHPSDNTKLKNNDRQKNMSGNQNNLNPNVPPGIINIQYNLTSQKKTVIKSKKLPEMSLKIQRTKKNHQSLPNDDITKKLSFNIPIDQNMKQEENSYLVNRRLSKSVNSFHSVEASYWKRQSLTQQKSSSIEICNHEQILPKNQKTIWHSKLIQSLNKRKKENKLKLNRNAKKQKQNIIHVINRKIMKQYFTTNV